MLANALSEDPFLTLGMGSIGQRIQLYQNMVMVNFKLKGIITKCSSMVANVLPANPSLTLGMGSIEKENQNMVMLLINLKGINKSSSMVANILPADPSLTLGMGSFGQNFHFFRTWSCCISN